ncbi:MAG: gamma-glutamyltransferase [Gammaproteobacteria bacterium]|nr:gamma-glutamyltransferase [Gammaproteobacteria bacterium]
MVHNNLIRTLCIVLGTSLLLLAACSSEAPAERATAAVAMPDTYSATVANDILAQGGNAVDASIAAAFALAVTLPEAGNIGGGGFMLVQFDGEAKFIDYRETAPLAANRDMYLDENGDAVLRDSLVGHRAAGVPGTVAGLWKAHQMYGSLPWRELVEPAVRLAADGFIVHEQLANAADESVDWFGNDVNFQEYFGALKSGELFRQEDLAKTLARIAADGPDDFYRGETANLIVAEMQRGNGLISAEDLQRYEAVVREPLRADWRGFEILAAPPPSSGGFAVIQLLKMKDLLQHEFDQVPHNSPQYIHLVAEIEKRVFADRAEYLGDPDYFDVPIDKLLSDSYLRQRASQIDPDNISSIDAVPPGIESMDTTHFSILDNSGNAVSNTYTLNWTFGNGVVVGGAGFLLNDEMDDFSVKPGVANAYGAVGGTANEIQPGKRMLSSMSPTILLQDGQVRLVVGTPGGTTIFTSVFQAITNIYDFGMTPLQAAAAGRFHHQLLPPDLVTYSPGVPLSADVISTLGDLGYRAEPHPFRFGDVQLIQIVDGETHAASDPRNRGEARVTN